MKLKRSVDMTSSGKNGLNIRTMGQDQVSGGVKVVQCLIWDLNFSFNLEIFYAKVPNSGNLSHFHGTRTLILSWMHVKHMPGNGPRKRMSSSTLFPNGLSRSVKW